MTRRVVRFCFGLWVISLHAKAQSPPSPDRAQFVTKGNGRAPAKTPKSPDEIRRAIDDSVSLAVKEDKEKEPQFPSAIDPVTSAPTPGAAPSLSAPRLDLLGATIEASKEGTTVSGVFLPFWMLERPKFLLSDMRVEVHGSSTVLQKAGFSVSTGYSSATEKLQLSPAEVKAAIDSCFQRKQILPILNAANVLADKLGLPGLRYEELVKQHTVLKDQSVSARKHGQDVFVAFQRLDPPKKEAFQAYGDQLEDALNSVDDEIGNCWTKKIADEKIQHAYGNGYAFRIFGGADMFPHVSGPKIGVEKKESDGSTTMVEKDANPNVLASWNVGASYGFFTSRDFRLWLTGSFSRSRKKTTVEDLSSRLGVGLDVAGNIRRGNINEDGFSPGFTVGGFVSLQACLESVGCDEEVAGYTEPPLKAAHIKTIGVYLDIRSSSKVQLRIGLPVTYIKLASAPNKDIDDSLSVWGIAPTVSLTVASWVLTPKTTN